MTDKTKAAAKSNSTEGTAKTKGEGEGTRAVNAPKAPAAPAKPAAPSAPSVPATPAPATPTKPSVPSTPVKAASEDKTPAPPAQPAPFTPAATDPKNPTQATSGRQTQELDPNEEGISAEESRRRELVNKDLKNPTPPPPAQPEPFTPAATDPNAVPRESGQPLPSESERREAAKTASENILNRDPNDFVADPKDLPVQPANYAAVDDKDKDRG
jgi:hypothetical protein